MFGPHVDRIHAEGKDRPSITAHIRAARAAATAASFDARMFQVFVAGPRTRSITLLSTEADELRAYLDADGTGKGVRVIAHGTYADYPWHGNLHSVKFIKEELAVCERAGISGLVIHLGKPGPDEVAKYLPDLISKTPAASASASASAAAAMGPAEQGTPASKTLIYLEVPHVRPENSHYETPEKLAELFRAVREVDPELSRFGLCIDTAHLWSCGEDLQSFEVAENWLHRLERVADVIPPNRIIIHLNDSLDARGSGVDRHAPLFQGKIWSDYKDRPRQSGLAAFVDYIVRNDTPAVLERKPKEALLDDYTALDRLTEEVRLE